ncbi:MAG: hypothetical protein V4529_12285 [Gemmatimonadota bacterium]
MKDRASLLRSLIDFDDPIQEIMAELQQLPWDVEIPVVQFSVGDATSVLRRYEAGQLSAPDIEAWANAIEGRDDIGIDDHLDLREMIYQLANPSLTQRLTRDAAQGWLKKLGG